jgi:hypothetical protein
LTISRIKNSGATAIVIAKNQIMLIRAQEKAMKIIIKALSLLLALTTSVRAETIDLHIQNTNKFTPRMLPSQEYFGSECATSLVTPVGWALPTDHLKPEQKEFKLFNSITYCTLRERAISH